MMSCICLSNILLRAHKTDMPLFSVGPFLCIGVIFARFHSVGNFPLTMLLFMSVVTDAVRAGAAAFNSLALILSAPVDLSERRAMSLFYTVCCLISGIENDVSNLSLTKCLS